MKDLINKLLEKLHFVIILYGLYAAYGVYEEHAIKMEELNGRFPGVESEIVVNTKKVKEMQEFVKKAEESKVRVEEVAKNIESAQKQLPSEINDSEIIGLFSEEINSLNIKDPGYLPGGEKPSTYFISKEYSIKAKGTFLQLLVFLERVGNATRIFNVKKVKFVNTEPNQRGRFQMISFDATIEAFRYNPDFKVDRGFEPTPPKPVP